MDFIYVQCKRRLYPLFTIQAYDASIPHDLLMITVVVASSGRTDYTLWLSYNPFMVGIEDTSTLYVSVWECSCIWKIDLVNNIAGEWLSDLGDEFHLSVASENHLLVLKVSDGVPRLGIYDEDANLVRNVSLSNEFRAPLRAIQKPDGEFIFSHRSKEDNSMCLSFLSTEGIMIDQFKLKEAVGFRDAKVFISPDNNTELEGIYFAIEVFSGNVYILDENTWELNLTDYSAIFSNSSEESHRKIDGVQFADGRTLSDIKEKTVWPLQFAELIWDTDGYLFVIGNVFGDLYQFDTKTLKWRQIPLGRQFFLRMYYSAKKNQLIFRISYKNLKILGIYQIWT